MLISLESLLGLALAHSLTSTSQSFLPCVFRLTSSSRTPGIKRRHRFLMRPQASPLQRADPFSILSSSFCKFSGGLDAAASVLSELSVVCTFYPVDISEISELVCRAQGVAVQFSCPGHPADQVGCACRAHSRKRTTQGTKNKRAH